MDSNQSADYYEFMDAELSMRVPSYLRQRKGMRFFEARSKRDKRHPLLSIAIEFQDEQGLSADREMMMRLEPGATEEWMGLQARVVRRGTVSYVKDGFELLTTNYDPDNGNIHNGYNLCFVIDSRHIYATFFGQGELSAFDESCKRIVSSIRLVEGGDERFVAKPASRATRGMRPADRSRLQSALDALPPEIAYLRRPLMEIAKEDQDLLGSGEGDIRPVERALRRVASPDEIESVAEAHAKLLHDWLLSLPDHEGAWTAPVWFVEGILRGRARFGPNSAQS